MAEHVMMSIISYINGNLQPSITITGVLTRTAAVKEIDMALIQEPWYCEGSTMGQNILGYTLFSASRTDRPRACIMARDKNTWMLLGLSCSNLVAVLVNYKEGKTERCLVVCSGYLPYVSSDPPLTRESEELVCYCEEENLYLVTGCDSNSHHTLWGSTNCNDRGMDLLEFLNSLNLKILNQVNDSTYYSARRIEVNDTTLGSFGLIGSLKGWEVSSEPSLLDHRYFLFTLEGSLPVILIRIPRGTKWDSFREGVKNRLKRGTQINMKDEGKLGLAILCVLRL